MDDCLELESKPEMVMVARRFVRDRLASWEATDFLSEAVLIASELVTNAMLHARTSIELKVLVHDGVVRVEVYDENPRLPSLSACPPGSTSGRGLALVAALASGWGIEHRDDGKVVWAEMGPVRVVETDDECVDLSGVDTVEEAFRRLRDSDADPAPS